MKSSGILHFTDGRPGAMSPVMDNQPGEALPLTKRESMLFYHSVVSTKKLTIYIMTRFNLVRHTCYGVIYLEL